MRGWCRHVMAAAADFASCHDELRGEPVASEVAGALGMIDANGEVLVDLEVEVRGVHPVVVADGADLLAPLDLLALAHAGSVKVRIEGIGEVELAVLDPGMTHDDDVPPGDMDVPCQHDDPVANRVDGSAESLGAASVGHPVLTEVTSGSEAP